MKKYPQSVGNQWTNRAIKIMIGMGIPTIHKRIERTGFS
jgi:hypothetical protein